MWLTWFSLHTLCSLQETNKTIRNSIFSGTEQFFPGTQAFLPVYLTWPGELAKAYVPGKKCSVPEKIEFLIEYQTE